MLNDMGSVSVEAMSMGATTMNSLMSRLSKSYVVTKDKSGIYAELSLIGKSSAPHDCCYTMYLL